MAKRSGGFVLLNLVNNQNVLTPIWINLGDVISITPDDDPVIKSRLDIRDRTNLNRFAETPGEILGFEDTSEGA